MAALLLLLLISALAQANSNCYHDIDLEIVHKCKDMYATLELALLTPGNLYILREAFYPTNGGSPHVLHFNFSVQLPNNVTLVAERGWTSSGFLRIVNPVTLAALQSGIVLHYLTPIQRITLILDVQNATTLKVFNRSDLMSVLTILTTRVSVCRFILHDIVYGLHANLFHCSLRHMLHYKTN